MYVPFVKQLINDLQHGCNIGYLRPQFAILATNLASALGLPEVIDTELQKECESGRILGPFQTPPLPPLHNFRMSGLSLIPKHDGGWQVTVYTTSWPLHHIALTIL